MIAMRSASFSALCLLALAAPRAAQDAAKKLFLANCAPCHGETGDGHGTTQLDRPARSFMDGGFSFGNTPEALFKTISTGIPGSPMPAFDASLKEEERRLLASYVVTLGPPVEEVKVEDTILAVHDRPVVVRGKLPALAEGLPEHARGLLIGDPSGITFEYQVDDVRLLALRQGGFVERTDWGGRGGTALNPLGKVVYLAEGGKPGPLFSVAGGTLPLEAHLSGTHTNDGVEVAYHLVRNGHELAHVVETPRVVKLPVGTGFVRSFELIGGASRVHLALADPTQGPGEELLVLKRSTMDKYGNVTGPGVVRKQADGTPALHRLTVAAGVAHWAQKDGVLIVELEPGEHAQVALETVPLGEWNDSVKKQLEKLGR